MEAKLPQAISPEGHLWRLTAFGQELCTKEADKHTRNWPETFTILIVLIKA